MMYHFGLIGFPLGHSLSPRLHASALEELGMDGDYQLFPVPPLPEGSPRFDDLFGRLREKEFNGFNVTIPHKQSVLPWLDDLAPGAEAIGAINCIYCREGRLVGDNTDVPGFLTDLNRILSLVQKSGKDRQNQSHHPPGHALILGAGGSARAVAFALDQGGWEITIAARRIEQAEELVKSLELSKKIQHVIALIPLSRASIQRIQPDIRLVVNTTPLGMAPNLEANPWPEGSAFPKGALVYDLVYNPPETALMRAAQRAGASVANGLGMLVEQAALSFELWTGYPAPRDVMRLTATGMRGRN
jgi:shikimate dehydrogenase